MATRRDLPQWRLHQEIARRRAYVHPYRWTSLGLALIEAMHIGLPVVALATTEVPEAVPPASGFVSNRIERLQEGLQRLGGDRRLAQEMGEAAREHALRRYGLARFLNDWDWLLEEVTKR
jgi:glycosyltransferase involved in cell wall biosynthesis